MEVKLLRITDLSKKYGEHHALKHVSIHVNKGEIIGIVGENGSGKSTLLKTIYGSEETRDYKGMIFLDSKELKIKNPYEKVNIYSLCHLRNVDRFLLGFIKSGIKDRRDEQLSVHYSRRIEYCRYRIVFPGT